MSSRFDLPLAHYDIEATLDAKGLQVKLPEDLPVDLEDAVLEYVPGDPIPCGNVSRQKAVSIAESQLSSRDSWLGSNIVNDEQARRDEVYRRTTARGIAFAYPSYPALLGWTPLWKVPLNWQPERSTRGSALVVLPVRLNPVASGTDVRVPHSVIRVETPQSIGSFSTAFFNTSGWWGDATSLPASVPIRFHLPSQACPLDVREIECQLQIRAPQRNVRVYARTDANADPIHKIRVADRERHTTVGSKCCQSRVPGTRTIHHPRQGRQRTSAQWLNRFHRRHQQPARPGSERSVRSGSRMASRFLSH